MTSYKNYLVIITGLLCLAGCSSGFLGIAPLGDRKEYVHAREEYDVGNYQAAAQELSDYIYKAKNVTRREARAYRLLGLSYEKIGLPEKALEVYSEALEFHPKNVPLLLEAGRLYQANGLTTQSIEMYERTLAQDPNNETALIGQAENYTTLGFYSKARQFYDQFFTVAPEILPIYRARYARTFLRERNYEQAFLLITQALQQENTQPDFWRISAEALRGLNRPQEALTDLETALLLAPQRTDLLAQKALWQFEADELDLSLQTAQEILRQEPDNALAQLIQALNWRKQGNIQDAQKQVEKIAQQTPDSFVGQVAKKLAQRN